jgi:hypothetical protein
MSLPMWTNHLTNSFSSELIYKALYEIYFIGNQFKTSSLDKLESRKFTISDNKIECVLNDSKDIKIEEFKNVEHLIVIQFDKTDKVFKYMSIDVNYKDLTYSLDWESNNLNDDIKVYYDLVNMETFMPDDEVIKPNELAKKLRRDINLSNILES